MARLFWGLGSRWESPPPDPHVRHAVDLEYELAQRIMHGKLKASESSLRFESSRKAELEDFPFCDVPVVSSRAKEFLSGWISKKVRFVPVELTRRSKRLREPYYLLYCTDYVSTLDMKRTPPELVDRYGRLKPAHGEGHHDFARVPIGIHLFRCKEDPPSLLISDELAESLVATTLSGWMIWPRRFGPHDDRRTVTSATQQATSAASGRRRGRR